MCECACDCHMRVKAEKKGGGGVRVEMKLILKFISDGEERLSCGCFVSTMKFHKLKIKLNCM